MRWPLLTALAELDLERGTGHARGLILLAAVIHRSADERRTAEYLLRNRSRVTSGRQSALALLSAARCAAEMDERRVRVREVPDLLDNMTVVPVDPGELGSEWPSVGEVVIDRLDGFAGLRPSTGWVRDRVLDAVTIAMELAERHVLNRGSQPSLIAMRANARPDSRLVTHLRREFGNEVAARRIAHLLVGSEDAPLESAFLWWCAQRGVQRSDVPDGLRERWSRDFRAADAALAAGEPGVAGLPAGA